MDRQRRSLPHGVSENTFSGKVLQVLWNHAGEFVEVEVLLTEIGVEVTPINKKRVRSAVVVLRRHGDFVETRVSEDSSGKVAHRLKRPI